MMPPGHQTPGGIALSGGIPVAKVTTDDLTVEQIEHIEREVGYPINRWVSDAPKGGLYPLILAAVNGDDPKRYRVMKLPELLALVSLDDDEGSDPEA